MTEFHKLVRDRIPDIIRADGQTPVVEVLRAEQRRPALLAKLVEEAAEAVAAADAELAEELADVLEVVRALAGALGLSLAQVAELAEDKRQRRGGFEQGFFLVRADPDDRSRHR